MIRQRKRYEYDLGDGPYWKEGRGIELIDEMKDISDLTSSLY